MSAEHTDSKPGGGVVDQDHSALTQAQLLLEHSTRPELLDPSVAQRLAEYVTAASADPAYRGSIVCEVEDLKQGLAIESILDIPDYDPHDETIAAIHTRHGLGLTTPGSHHALRGMRLWGLGSHLALHDPFFIPTVINQGKVFDMALADPSDYITRLNEVHQNMGSNYDTPRRFLGMLQPQRA